MRPVRTESLWVEERLNRHERSVSAKSRTDPQGAGREAEVARGWVITDNGSPVDVARNGEETLRREPVILAIDEAGHLYGALRLGTGLCVDSEKDARLGRFPRSLGRGREITVREHLLRWFSKTGALPDSELYERHSQGRRAELNRVPEKLAEAMGEVLPEHGRRLG